MKFELFTSPLALLSVFSAIGNAAPTVMQNERRAIDQTLFNRLKLMSQYSASSYCVENNNSPGSKVTCSAKNCPLVEASSTRTSTEFENSLETDVTGYVAVDTTNKLIVVSFRGSSSIRNWMANLDFDTVNTDLCSGCSVHHGFWNSWQEARGRVLAAIKDTAAANPSFQIVSVGHSLGGAIATLAAAELRKSGRKVELYTFGAPRFAGAALSDLITSQGNNFRVTHYNDPVPRLPPSAFGFVHISPEFYIDASNFATATASDIRTFTGNNNKDGNGAWIVQDVFAHMFYLGQIAACFPLIDISVKMSRIM